MGPHDVYDYGNIEEEIIGHIGAAIYDNGPLAQPNASAGSNRVRLRPSAHNTESLLTMPGQP